MKIGNAVLCLKRLVNNEANLLVVKNLGLITYKDALNIQNETRSSLLNGKPGQKDTLLLLEHNPVYTIGIRSKLYSKEDELRLNALGAEFVKTNRGGLITFHGPGQLVAYPILYLGNYNKSKSMKWYISQLEQCTIKMCQQFGLNAQISPHTGVWIALKKIAAIGVRGSQYVTTHGIAINCNTDLSWFSHIVPCGIPNKGVTSLSQELKRNVTVEEAIPIFLHAFREQFECNLDTDIKI